MKKYFFFKWSSSKVIFSFCILPLLLQIVLLNLVSKEMEKVHFYFVFFLIWLLCLPYFYWYHSSVKYLYNQAKNYFKIDIVKFNSSLIIIMLTFFNMVVFVAYIFHSFLIGQKPEMYLINIMMIFQFLGVLSFVYNSYFVNKLIATIELKREVNFKDFSNSFFPFPFSTMKAIQRNIKKMNTT